VEDLWITCRLKILGKFFAQRLDGEKGMGYTSSVNPTSSATEGREVTETDERLVRFFVAERNRNDKEEPKSRTKNEKSKGLDQLVLGT